MRLLLPLTMLVGCHRPVDGSERPHQLEVPTARHVAVMTDLPIAAPSTDGSVALSTAAMSGRETSCTEGISTQASTDARMSEALKRCGKGLIAKRAPIGWKAATSSPVDVGEQEPGGSTCVRAIVALNQPGQSARVSIVDGADRVLSSASGYGIVLVPDDGVYCVPSPIKLRIQITAEKAPLTGLAAFFESP